MSVRMIAEASLRGAMPGASTVDQSAASIAIQGKQRCRGDLIARHQVTDGVNFSYVACGFGPVESDTRQRMPCSSFGGALE